MMERAERKFLHGDDEDESDPDPPLWILKPSATNKGSGILLVRVYDEALEAVYEESMIREWVLQRYVSPPLLLGGRKFHIRARPRRRTDRPLDLIVVG